MLKEKQNNRAKAMSAVNELSLKKEQEKEKKAEKKEEVSPEDKLIAKASPED